ncbi:MAG: hypothetical protein ACREMQ_13035, partial [Longimicrobiales bacterium]
RMYESVLRALAAEGHDIQILANRRDTIGSGIDPEPLLADLPRIRWIWEDLRPHAWTELAAAVRIWLDYLRYFEPRYRDAPRLRMRVGEHVPPLLRRITGWALFRANGARRALVAVLRAVERALPRQQELDTLMRDSQPNIVVVTPLLDLGSRQIEVLRSARARGARTALAIGSWDHLSSKGRISELPDRVLVWNETQVREAAELHGIPGDRLVVTGAQCYDQWFGRAPTRTREQFCAMLRLPADRPFLLYACSALYPLAPTEARFVRQWIEQIRASDDPLLRSAAVLVRPHPTRMEEWSDVDLTGLPDVTLYGSLPVDDRSKDDYFESLHYCAAMVGLNTSAFIEAAIVGRPVHTIVVPEFSERQEGTLHFHYLKSVGGGVFRLARTFGEHRAQLAASLREPVSADVNAGFVTAFVRPFGLDRPATDIFVAALVDLGRSPAPAPAREPLWAPALRLLLRPAALATHAAVARIENPVDRTLLELQRARRKDEYRRERDAERQRRATEREAAHQEKVRRADAARQAELNERRERIEASEREKRARKTARESEKRQRARAKRRAAVMAQIRRRIGWKQAP